MAADTIVHLVHSYTKEVDLVNTQEILQTRLLALGLPKKVSHEIFFEWFISTYRHQYQDLESARAAITSKEYEQHFQILTVNDVIRGYGNMPRRTNNDRFGRYFKIPIASSFVQFVQKLRKLGLTSTNWPLLAQTLRELYRALLAQANGDKEKLRNVTILALEVPGFITEPLGRRLGKCRVDITLGDLLKIRPSELQRLSGRKCITKTINDAKAALRSLGFTSDDGDFLFENSLKDVAIKISSDLGVDVNDARRFFKYFQAYFKIEEPITEE